MRGNEALSHFHRRRSPREHGHGVLRGTNTRVNMKIIHRTPRSACQCCGRGLLSDVLNRGGYAIVSLIDRHDSFMFPRRPYLNRTGCVCAVGRTQLIMDGNASGKSATSRRGCCSAQSASTFETRCYERVLRCEQQGQSSALFRDAELVDSPKEVKHVVVLVDPRHDPC